MKVKKLSIVIPLYNEQKRIKGSWKKIQGYFEAKPYVGELIFVNDGCTDNTLKMLRELKANFPVKIVSYPTNRGKGYAIKQGVLASSKDIVLFFDIDLSTALEMTEKFLENFTKNSILIGTRESPQSTLIKRQNFLREKMGRAFTLIVNFVLQSNCSDYTCGFKMFPANLGKKIFSKAKINRWGFDAELIFLAKKFGTKIKEIPVVWEHKKNSKVNLKKDVLYSFFELLKICYYDLLGKY